MDYNLLYALDVRAEPIRSGSFSGGNMAIPLKQLKGMDDDLAKKLKAKNIRDSDQYLEASASSKQRRALAKELEVNEKAILELANRADLARMKGVAGIYSDLLEQAGVDTIKELATRNPENLHAKIIEVNNEKRLATRLPTVLDVLEWVEAAQAMPKVLTY
jgi:predicted flap endonuclease-1-like 5' DNA nuclease